MDDSPQHPVPPTTCPHFIPLKKPSSTPFIHQFTLFSCSLLVRSSQKLGSKYQVSGSGPRDVAKQLKEQQMVHFLSFTSLPWYLTTIRSWLVITKDPCTNNLNMWSPLPPLLVVPSLDYSPLLQISQVLSAVELVFLWPWWSFTVVCYLLFFIPFVLNHSYLMNVLSCNRLGDWYVQSW